MGKDNLGDRMKLYERTTQGHINPRSYVIIRIDGRSFHKFTKHMDKPFDSKLSEAFMETTQRLLGSCANAKLGYTQSDEISLLLTFFDNMETDTWFDGNIQKLVSVTASMATAAFSRRYPLGYATFDSRVFTLPNQSEVSNYFLWRIKDAQRNAVSSVAYSLFTEKDLAGKSTTERRKMSEERIGKTLEEAYPKNMGGTLILHDIGAVMHPDKVIKHAHLFGLIPEQA